MQPLTFDHITVKKLYHQLYIEKDVEVSVLRLDKIHPIISGNKWFKLKNYLQDVKNQNKKTILTFGGAFSNHIISTACACKLYELKSVGIIRGERPIKLSGTLLEAEKYGMHLIFISRKEYKEKIIPPELRNNDEVFIINEGGYGQRGASGISDMLKLFNTSQYSHICCAVGTGTMMAGLIKAASPDQNVIGISVLKNNMNVETAVKNLLNEEEANKQFKIIYDFHFGGYAKYTQGLIDFMNDFYKSSAIPSDFVYTGKLFFLVTKLIKNNFFPKGSRLLLIHSGGLQGNHSLPEGKLNF